MGKTLWLEVVLLYLSQHSPATAMVVLPGQSDAQDFRDRIYALAAASGIEIPRENRWNMRFVELGGMRIYLAWSGSRRRLRGKRCKYVFLSEVDVYSADERAGNPLEAAKQRVKGFPRYLILYESSPIPSPSPIDAMERQSLRHRWHGRCPHCGTFQELRFFAQDGKGGVVGYRDDQGQLLDRDDVGGAHYVCLQGCAISSTDKQRFVEEGLWVPEGCLVDAAGQVVGDAERGRQDLGFHLWAVHSLYAWAHFAREYVCAQANGTVPEFWQHELGLSYRPRVTVPAWEELAAHAASEAYVRGQIPAWAWFCTAGADVQEREVYAVLRAWGDQRTSALVDWFVFDRAEGDEGELVKSDLAQLDQLVRGRWQVVGGANPQGRAAMPAVLIGVDANYRTLDVHHWIRSYPDEKRLRAVRGDGALIGEKYRLSEVRESRRERDDGTGPVVYEGGLQLWSIASSTFRLDLVDRFHAATDRPGAWLLPRDVVETGKHYLRQVVNEPPVYERGKDGRPKLLWKERETGLGHDFWDCEVIASALAQMFVDQLAGAPGWDATRWERQQAAAGESRPGSGPRPAARRRETVDRSAR